MCVPGEAGLLAPAVAALVLAQLNPVLGGFNRSLLLLERRVGELARDLAPRSPEGEGVQAAGEWSESRLEEVQEEVQEVRLLLNSHRTALDERLNSQHAVLQDNLRSFRTEVDVKLQHSEEMMQVAVAVACSSSTEQFEEGCSCSM